MECVEINNIEWEVNLYNNINKRTLKKKSNSNNINYPINSNNDFANDCWDFTKYNKIEQNKYLFIYDFSEFDYTYRNYVKKIVLYLFIIKRKRPKTVYTHFRNIYHFIKYLQSIYVYDLQLINVELLEEYYQDKNWGYDWVSSNKSSVKLLLSEFESSENIDFYTVIEYLKTRDKNAYLSTRGEGRTKIIPYVIFTKIISLAIKDIRSDNLTKFQRIIACMIVIIAESGMRVGELVRLERDMLETVNIDKERSIRVLKFKTYKTIKDESESFLWTESYVTEKIKFAYESLEDLTHDRNQESKYICLGRFKTKMDEYTFRENLIHFMVRHRRELMIHELDASLMSQFKKVVIDDKHAYYLGSQYKEIIGQTIYYVTPHQFRVTVCTRLYDLGIPLDYIREHLNHLDADMTTVYVRSVEYINREKEAREYMNSIVNDNGEIDVRKVPKEYRHNYEKINDFILANKFNINKDIDQIIKLLSKIHTPIIDLPEGYCARNAFLSICTRQEYITSRNDLYYLGLKIPLIEYAQFTYDRFLEKSKIVLYNRELALKNPIYTLECQREEKGLKKFIDKKLLPELQLIKEHINLQGKVEFIKKYPQLEALIEGIDYIIEQEVPKWL